MNVVAYRVVAYIAAILACLVWLLAAFVAYEFALVAFGVIPPGCCHGPPTRTLGILWLVAHVAVVAGIIWAVLSRWVHGHPAAALAIFLLSIPIGVFLFYSTAMEITPL